MFLPIFTKCKKMPRVKNDYYETDLRKCENEYKNMDV